MDIHLTDEELRREKNLFAPGKTWYESLGGVAFDIRAFAEQVSEESEEDELSLPPSSC